MLKNELDPTNIIPDDLYPFKQRAQGNVHHAFPIRCGIEPQYKVTLTHGDPLGTLSYTQVLREGYPGAIYHYITKPYRVYRVLHYQTEVKVKPERRRGISTRPNMQKMVFPRFDGGILHYLRSKDGFVVESELQVSERVAGFIERCGGRREEHTYGPGSTYAQRPLQRFIQTTGVCWYFQDRSSVNTATAERILEAFCNRFSVRAGDLGVAPFYLPMSPLGTERCQGVCIYDSTNGSLRLTQQLTEHFAEVVNSARAIVPDNEDDIESTRAANEGIEALQRYVVELTTTAIQSPIESEITSDSDCVEVIAPGERAMLVDGIKSEEVQIVNYRYTPRGLIYELPSPQPPVTKRTVPAYAVKPIHGVTKVIQVNLVTGEEKHLD